MFTIPWVLEPFKIRIGISIYIEIIKKHFNFKKLKGKQSCTVHVV